jgi:hypothetical protein
LGHIAAALRRDQILDFHRAALSAAGCAKIFEDKITGTAQKRPDQARAMKACAKGDVLVAWRLDRRGRSLGHLIQTRAYPKSMGTFAPELRDLQAFDLARLRFGRKNLRLCDYKVGRMMGVRCRPTPCNETDALRSFRSLFTSTLRSIARGRH